MRCNAFPLSKASVCQSLSWLLGHEIVWRVSTPIRLFHVGVGGVGNGGDGWNKRGAGLTFIAKWLVHGVH